MGRVRVRFAKGVEGIAERPSVASGLDQRFAVIQDTYVTGHPDMVFDDRLWLTLVDFLGRQSAAQEVRVTREEGQVVGLALFVSNWKGVARADREPPPLVEFRTDAATSAVMATEYWSRVGGPEPYHDSYTYAIWTRDDVEEALREYLALSVDGGAWQLEPNTIVRDIRRQGISMQERALKWLLIVGGAAIVISAIGILTAPLIVRLLSGSWHGVGG